MLVRYERNEKDLVHAAVRGLGVGLPLARDDSLGVYRVSILLLLLHLAHALLSIAFVVHCRKSLRILLL